MTAKRYTSSWKQWRPLYPTKGLKRPQLRQANLDLRPPKPQFLLYPSIPSRPHIDQQHAKDGQVPNDLSQNHPYHPLQPGPNPRPPSPSEISHFHLFADRGNLGRHLGQGLLDPPSPPPGIVRLSVVAPPGCLPPPPAVVDSSPSP